MAWTASGGFVQTTIDKWDDTLLSTDLTSETDLKAAFFGPSVTPDFSQTPSPAYGAAPWNAGESAGAGYTPGGVLVVNTTLTIAPAGSVKFDADNFSLSESTIIAEGYLLYDDAHADRALAGVWFGEEFETQDGTFLVTHDSLGIFVLDLTP